MVAAWFHGCLAWLLPSAAFGFPTDYESPDFWRASTTSFTRLARSGLYLFIYLVIFLRGTGDLLLVGVEGTCSFVCVYLFIFWGKSLLVGFEGKPKRHQPFYGFPPFFKTSPYLLLSFSGRIPLFLRKFGFQLFRRSPVSTHMLACQLQVGSRNRGCLPAFKCPIVQGI